MKVSKKVLIVVAKGFEEIELISPVDILLRGGVEVVLASLHNYTSVPSARGIQLSCDKLLSEIDIGDFDMLVLPGGPGVKEMRNSSFLLGVIRDFHAKGKWIGAICAAPLVLLDAGILQDTTITSFPGVKLELMANASTQGISYSEDVVVKSNRLLTSRAAGTSAEFAFQLLTLLQGEEESKRVREAMLF